MARTALRALALVAAAAVFCAVLAAPDDAHAFEFELGSDGSYGPIDITTDTTLPLPPDGVFHATTINIAAGATLTFTPNADNTGVVLLATGDVTLAGTIDVSGFDSVGATGGDPGPGGSRGDSYVVGGGYGEWYPRLDSREIRSHMFGGVGGGDTIAAGCGGTGGGGGGGAVAIVANTSIVAVGTNAALLARGGRTCANNYGNGGFIWLTAPTVDLANLTIDTNNGEFFTNPSGYSRIERVQGSVPVGISQVRQRLTSWQPNPISSVEIVSIDGLPLDANDDVQLTGQSRPVDIEIRVVGCNGAELEAAVRRLPGSGTYTSSIPGAALMGDDVVTVTTATLDAGTVYQFRADARCEF